MADTYTNGLRVLAADPDMRRKAQELVLRSADEIDRLRDGIRGLHFKGSPQRPMCVECGRAWPCPTRKLVDGG